MTTRPHRVVEQPSGGVKIELGSVVQRLVTLGAVGAMTTILSIPLLAYQVHAQDKTITAMSEKIVTGAEKQRDTEEAIRRIDANMKNIKELLEKRSSSE